jgi:hypothetical protein
MVKTLKTIVFKAYVVALMAFTVWYGYFMYPLIFGFEGKEAAAVSLREAGQAGAKEEQMFVRLIAEQPKERKKTDLGYRVIEQPYIEGRFHNIGFTLDPDTTSTCIRCHGNAPHAESKKARAFMNMHTFYLACETCHSPPAAGAPPWDFRWHDKKTGKVVANPRQIFNIEEAYRKRRQTREYPVYGDYGAKISPSNATAGEPQLLHGPKEMAEVERYLAGRGRIDDTAKKERLDFFHQKVAKESVRCESCHRGERPYIPFAELGYPPTRLRELADNPVIGMLSKYDRFYMPKLVAPADKSRKGGAD